MNIRAAMEYLFMDMWNSIFTSIMKILEDLLCPSKSFLPMMIMEFARKYIMAVYPVLDIMHLEPEILIYHRCILAEAYLNKYILGSLESLVSGSLFCAEKERKKDGKYYYK